MAEEIKRMEEAAADAVPPAVVELCDGWRLRFNYGVKRRPNSVLANAHHGMLTVGEKTARAEAFYAEHGAKARFQLCPASQPEDLGTALEARGYLRAPGEVLVQTACLTQRVRAAPAANVILLPQATDAWLGLYCRVEGLEGVKARALREMLGRLPGRSAFALARADGQPAAVGLGVAHGGLLGLFNLATHPNARRKGLATAVLEALTAWGSMQGASGVYLQVAEGNRAARSVYERCGLRTRYSYYYLEAP